MSTDIPSVVNPPSGLCVANGWRLDSGTPQVLTDIGAPRPMFVEDDMREPIVYEIQWQIFQSSLFLSWFEHFETVGLSRSFEWTPPDQTSAARYIYTAVSIVISSHTEWVVSATLERFY